MSKKAWFKGPNSRNVTCVISKLLILTSVQSCCFVGENLCHFMSMDVCDFAAPAAETLNKISLGDKKFGAKREWKKWVECNGRKIDNQCPNNSAHTDNWGSKAGEAKPVNLTSSHTDLIF